jgi:hypothetical protein
LTSGDVFEIQRRNNYTQSLSRSQRSGLLDRNTVAMINQTNVRSEESRTKMTEYGKKSRKIMDGTPVNIELNDFHGDFCENEIMIGDSTVEVVNSPYHDVHADKQSYHSTITSGVQAIGPCDRLSGVQNLQVDDVTPSQRRSVGYQIDSDEDGLQLNQK